MGDIVKLRRLTNKTSDLLTQFSLMCIIPTYLITKKTLLVVEIRCRYLIKLFYVKEEMVPEIEA